MLTFCLRSLVMQRHSTYTIISCRDECMCIHIYIYVLHISTTVTEGIVTVRLASQMLQGNLLELPFPAYVNNLNYLCPISQRNSLCWPTVLQPLQNFKSSVLLFFCPVGCQGQEFFPEVILRMHRCMDAYLLDIQPKSII